MCPEWFTGRLENLASDRTHFEDLYSSLNAPFSLFSCISALRDGALDLPIKIEDDIFVNDPEPPDSDMPIASPGDIVPGHLEGRESRVVVAFSIIKVT
jgi:hypothetical protein